MYHRVPLPLLPWLRCRQGAGLRPPGKDLSPDNDDGAGSGRDDSDPPDRHGTTGVRLSRGQVPAWRRAEEAYEPAAGPAAADPVSGRAHRPERGRRQTCVASLSTPRWDGLTGLLALGGTK
jgi:hypothetical protein